MPHFSHILKGILSQAKGLILTLTRLANTTVMTSGESTIPIDIMPAVGYSNGTNFLPVPIGSLICGINNSIWFRGTFTDVSNAGNYIMGRTDASTRRMGFISAQRFAIQPNLSASLRYIDCPWYIKNNVVYDICVLSKGSGVWELYINGRYQGSVTSTDSTITIYNIMRASFTGQIHFFGVYNRLLTAGEIEARTIITTDLKAGYFPTGRGLYEYDISGNGMNLAWGGDAGHTSYAENGLTYYLNNGWKLYQKAGQADEIVPIGATTTAIVAAGYTLTKTYAGSSTAINMFPCSFKFGRVVPVSDVRTPLTGTANLGTAGAGTLSIFLNDRRQRIRQTCDLKFVKFYYVDNTPANTTSVKLQIWRETTTFTKVYELDITSQTVNTGTGIKTINVPSWSVEEGDFYGFEVVNSGANLLLFSTADGITYLKANPDSLYTYAGAVPTVFDWRTSGTAQQTSLIINGYAIAPQFAAIGDSITSGAGTGSLSFVDPYESTVFDPPKCFTGKMFILNENLIYHNLGVAGDEIIDINGDKTTLNRFQIQAANSKAKIIYIQGGINDVKEGDFSNELIAETILNMVDKTNDMGAFPIVEAVGPWNAGSTLQMQNRDAINALVVAGMTTRNGIVVNYNSEIGEFRTGGDVGNTWNYKSAYSDDNLHPNEAGTILKASILYQLLIDESVTIYDYVPKLYDVLDRGSETYQNAASRLAYIQTDPYQYTIIEMLNISDYLNEGYADYVAVESTSESITAITVKEA